MVHVMVGKSVDHEWKKNFPAVKLRPQTPPIHKREIGDAAVPGNAKNIFLPQQPPHPTRAISQWGHSLEWRHAVTLHTAVGKNCITFFSFSCEACSLYLVLWLCGRGMLLFRSGGVYFWRTWRGVYALYAVHTYLMPCRKEVFSPIGPSKQIYKYIYIYINMYIYIYIYEGYMHKKAPNKLNDKWVHFFFRS